MVVEYKKIAATADGYRGSRAILNERVIEGLERPEFTDASLFLNVDTPQTLYLTDDNFGEDYFIVLPDASTLWKNWQVRIINNSTHTCNIYYYTSDLNQLNLFKEVTAGNMITCILLDNIDNTDIIGTWTNLRTNEETSADSVYKYSSDIFNTVEISWNQLMQNDGTANPTVQILLGTLAEGDSVKSVYIKTLETFAGCTSLTVDIGTQDNTGLFISNYNLMNAVSDTNFTKDLFDQILSTSSPTDIYATFRGVGLENLNAGLVKIVVHKPEVIDPTVLKNPIIQTSVPIGVIMSYSFDDIPNGYWRLDGTIFPNATTSIPQFVQKLNLVNNRLTGEKLIISETQWNNINEAYGSCGKFAWVGSGLRFPKINCFVQGLNDLTKLAQLVEAGLPSVGHYHLDGWFRWGSNNGWFTTKNTNVGAEMPSGGGSTGWNGSGGGGGHSPAGHLTGNMVTSLPIEQSTVNGVFGKSNTVQPQSIKFPYIISVYNKIQNESAINVDELIKYTVQKVNTNLNNIEYDSVDVLDKMKFVSWMMPNYDAGVVVARNIAFTAPFHGYISFTPINNVSTAISLDRQISGYISIAGKTVLTSTFSYGNDSVHPDSGFFPISQNEIAFHNMSSGTVYFYPVKGAI